MTLPFTYREFVVYGLTFCFGCIFMFAATHDRAIAISAIKKFITRSKPYIWFMRKVLPKLRFTNRYGEFDGKDFLRAWDILKPGDILLSVDKSKASAFLVPGYFSHAALCISKEGVNQIAEMTCDDYHLTTFYDFCRESDDVSIIRLSRDDDYNIKMIRAALSLAFAKYDLEFEHGNEALYCSELAAAADFENRLGLNPSKLYIEPDDIYKCALERGQIVYGGRNGNN